MNISTPSLPSLKHLPFYVTIDGVSGYLLGKLGQVNPELMTTIFVIRGLAHTIFYQIANFFLRRGGENLKSQKIFLTTSSAINLIFLIVLRELNLIGRLFSCVLGLAVIGHLIHRVCYIQEKERRLYQQGAVLKVIQK